MSMHALLYIFVCLILAVDRIYAQFENDDDGSEKLRLERPELEDYILKTIAKTLGGVKATKLTKEVDLFAFGVDSLQGTRIRNALQKELDLNGASLGQNVVYEYPSVQKFVYITRSHSTIIDHII